MINLEFEPNISLQDTRQAQLDGTSVMRSAHVGNMRAYNLTVASLGIRMLLVDHTIVAQTSEDVGDRNYLPGSRVTLEGITPLKLSQLGGLSLRTTISEPETGETQYLDEFHIASLQKAFPDTPFVTNTEYVRSEERVSNEVIKVALETSPGLFKRVVEDDGTLRKTENSFGYLAPIYGILQLNDNPRIDRGLLIPNEVDIVLNFVIECLRSGKDTQIHLSGPDMVQYTKNPRLKAEFNKLYESIRQNTSFGLRLPEELTIKLVPSAEARYATTKQRIHVLMGIFDNLRYRAYEEEKKATLMRPDSNTSANEKKAAIARFKTIEQLVKQNLSQAVPVASEFFAGPRDAPFLSQYDVLKTYRIPSGEQRIHGLAVAGENVQCTMAELKLITDALLKQRGGSP